MKRAEQVLWSLFAIAIVMRIAFGAAFFWSCTLALTLACFYFYFSIWLFNNIPLSRVFKKESYLGISGLRVVGCVLISFVYSNAVMAALYKLASWPGSFIMNILAILGLLISGTVIIIRLSKGTEREFYRGLLIRNVLMMLLCSSFMATFFLPVKCQQQLFNTMSRSNVSR